MISSDQYVSSVPGRLPNTYEKETASNKYMGGTIFIVSAAPNETWFLINVNPDASSMKIAPPIYLLAAVSFPYVFGSQPGTELTY